MTVLITDTNGIEGYQVGEGLTYDYDVDLSLLPDVDASLTGFSLLIFEESGDGFDPVDIIDLGDSTSGNINLVGAYFDQPVDYLISLRAEWSDVTIYFYDNQTITFEAVDTGVAEFNVLWGTFFFDNEGGDEGGVGALYGSSIARFPEEEADEAYIFAPGMIEDPDGYSFFENSSEPARSRVYIGDELVLDQEGAFNFEDQTVISPGERFAYVKKLIDGGADTRFETDYVDEKGNFTTVTDTWDIVEKEIPVEVIKEIEKIIEIEKEVPVEVIVEVEKIVEVLVEKEVPVEVIKEVEKIVEVE